MHISSSMKNDLLWGIENLRTQKRDIDRGHPDMIIYSDASGSGWGAYSSGVNTGGIHWKYTDGVSFCAIKRELSFGVHRGYFLKLKNEYLENR